MQFSLEVLWKCLGDFSFFNAIQRKGSVLFSFRDSFYMVSGTPWRSKMSLSRRNFLGLAAGAAGAAAMGLDPAALGQTRNTTKQPNVVLVLGDDHRWDALGCMGNSVVHTPQLDRLAKEGILFENHFCTTPFGASSRASIMSGQYAATTGIYDSYTALSPEQVKQTYWYQLKQAGYHIGFVGRFGVGGAPRRFFGRRGARGRGGRGGSSGAGQGMPSGEFDYWKGFGGEGSYRPNGPSGQHLTHVIRDQANEFFQSAPHDRPFCLSVSFKSPHVEEGAPAQYLPAPETLSLYKGITIPPISRAGADDIRRFPGMFQHSESRHRWAVRFATPELYQASFKGYYRLVNGMDIAIGSMRDTLERLGLADNTIIIYSADNGVFNGEHGLAGKWYGHEESIRIPLIIYDPRPSASHHGERRQAMTLNIDIHPTIVEMANLQPAAAIQGRSIVPQLRGDHPNARRIWYVESDYTDRGWVPSSQGIRTQRWKYVRYTNTADPFEALYDPQKEPYEELYDLENDKFETHNLIGQSAYAHQQRVLTGYWKTWRDSLRKGMSSWTQPVTETDLRRDGMLR